MTKKYTLFYANKLYGEGLPPSMLSTCPDGTYARREDNQWYHRKHWGWSEIAFDDLPPETKVIALIYPFD